MRARTAYTVRIAIPRACALGFLLVCASSALSQTTLRDYAGLGCLPIDEHKKSIYISYDDVKPDPASSSNDSKAKIWLRLHNNLSCGIRIPTAGDLEVTLPSGEKTVELLPDNARVAVIYQIQDYKRMRVPRTAPEFSGLHVIGWPILPPGKSISFSVPFDHFKQKFNIAVLFVYAWEGFNTQSLVHQVYFLNDALPEKAKR